MKTGTGIEIKNSDLIAKFIFGNKECPIGKFDPSDYPVLYDESTQWKNITQDIFDQLDDSEIFSNDEIEYLSQIPNSEFLNHILHK